MYKHQYLSIRFLADNATHTYIPSSDHSAKLIQLTANYPLIVTLGHAWMGCFPESFPRATTKPQPHICSFRHRSVVSSNLTTNVKKFAWNRTRANASQSCLFWQTGLTAIGRHCRQLNKYQCFGRHGHGYCQPDVLWDCECTSTYSLQPDARL